MLTIMTLLTGLTAFAGVDQIGTLSRRDLMGKIADLKFEESNSDAKISEIMLKTVGRKTESMLFEGKILDPQSGQALSDSSCKLTMSTGRYAHLSLDSKSIARTVNVTGVSEPQLFNITNHTGSVRALFADIDNGLVLRNTYVMTRKDTGEDIVRQDDVIRIQNLGQSLDQLILGAEARDLDLAKQEKVAFLCGQFRLIEVDDQPVQK